MLAICGPAPMSDARILYTPFQYCTSRKRRSTRKRRPRKALRLIPSTASIPFNWCSIKSARRQACSSRQTRKTSRRFHPDAKNAEGPAGEQAQ